ncbi:hypothetical protein AHAS_Ahas20G0188100 [Arachis hypogaea]
MVARNITKQLQILSTPINGDVIQNHKMNKRIIWDITYHHEMIHISILMHPMYHTPLIKSHHHLRKPSTHLCKVVKLHLPIFHLKILHHLTIPQHKASSKIHIIYFTNHKTHLITHKIHFISLNTNSPQYPQAPKIHPNLLLSCYKQNNAYKVP